MKIVLKHCMTALLAMLAVGEATGYTPRLNFNARLEPTDTVLTGAGQSTLQAFQDYTNAVGRTPMMSMEYLEIGDISKLAAMSRDMDPYGPEVALQIGLNVNDYAVAAAGGRDGTIAAFCAELNRLGRPVFLRIGYEANNRGYDPTNYRNTFIRITQALRANNVNAATVWNMLGGYTVNSMMPYYPGDEWVDWWGINLFYAWTINSSRTTDFLNAARSRGKPVMIGESTPAEIGTLQGQTSWDQWFAPYFQLIRQRPEIKAFSYINWNWPQFNIGLNHWGDCRIERNEVVRRLYQLEMDLSLYRHANLPPHAPVTYVDADLANTTGPAGWFEATASGNDGSDDNKWRLRTGMSVNQGNAFVSKGAENAPEIATTVNVANGIYEVFVFFWDNNGTQSGNNWEISAGLTSGSLTNYQGNSTPSASSLTFVANPIFTVPDLAMRYASLGQVTVSDGTLEVFVDDIPGNSERTWYDGIGYRLAGDNIAMTGSDASGATSFNAGTSWPGGAAPVAVNNYFTGANLLRTPTSGSHTFAGNSLTINSGGSLAFKGDGIITVNNLILAGGTVSQAHLDNSTASLAGAITLAASTTSTLSADGTNRQINVSATIGGNGNLTKTSVNTLTLSGTAANTYSGTTTLSAGKLVLGKSAGVNAIGGNLTIAPSSGWANAANGVELAANEQIADSAVISFTGSDWSGFRPKGFTETVGGLSSAAGRGVIENSGFGQSVATDGTLIINTANGTSYTYNGFIRDRDAGTSPGKLNLTKTGLGTQILLNSNITYTGTTTINQGTLKLSQTTGYASPTTTVGASGTLELNKTATGPANRTSQLTRSITGSGTLNINSDTSGIGGGWVTLRSGGSNLVNFTGTINIKSGVLSMDNLNGTLTGNPDLNVESGGLFGIRGQDVSVDALTGSGDVFNGWNGDTAGKTLTVGANNGSGTFSGVIHGNSTNPTDFTIEAGRLHLTKTGTGTQTLTGANTYSGQTTVSAGTLLLGATGSIANSSTIDVKSGATFDVLATGGFTVGASQTLKGSGTINGATAISGTLAPGDSAGTLTTDAVTFQPGSTFAFEIADWNGTTPGTDWDLLAADTLVFNNTPASKLTLVISGPAANFGEANRTFAIATAATSVTGFDPAAVAIDATAFTGSGTWAVQQNGLAIELVYTAGAGNTYAAWAAANAPGQTIAMDHDHDGVPNGIEFFMGESGSGFTALPAIDANRTISWTKDPAYTGTYGTHYEVETSTNLVDWDPVMIGEVTIGTTVDYTIPDGVPARFARLKVTGP